MRERFQRNGHYIAAKGLRFSGAECFAILPPRGLVAQSVEQRIENPCVGGSIPPRATTFQSQLFSVGFVVSGLPPHHAGRGPDLRALGSLQRAHHSWPIPTISIPFRSLFSKNTAKPRRCWHTQKLRQINMLSVCPCGKFTEQIGAAGVSLRTLAQIPRCP